MFDFETYKSYLIFTGRVGCVFIFDVVYILSNESQWNWYTCEISWWSFKNKLHGYGWKPYNIYFGGVVLLFLFPCSFSYVWLFASTIRLKFMVWQFLFLSIQRWTTNLSYLTQGMSSFLMQQKALTHHFHKLMTILHTAI